MFIRSLKINRSMFILSATIGFALSTLSEFLIASNTSINRPIEIWLYSQVTVKAGSGWTDMGQ